ncbi:TPA: phage terminase large subunit family protein [Escherichia coli]|nr:phage terminase large subunit family protein [Escherichia coli]
MNISNSQVNRLRHFVRAGLRSLFRPEPQTAVEWADANYYLPKESAYQEGRWETLPFQRAIMNAMGSDYIREVNVVKSARVGYSKMLLGVYAYFIEHKQRNTLIWLPTDGDAENFMKTHVEPTIRDIPSLLALAPWYGKKHRDNTLTMKRFSNGRGFWCLGGKAAKNYREKSVDVAGYDELAAFDEDIEQEGSPTFLGDKRIEGSVWPKSIRGSTPKVRGTCQIERAASESLHFMRFHVACPHCGEEQYLKFGDKETPFGLKWTPDDPSSVFYLCEHNACVIRQQELDFTDARYICEKTGIWTRDGILWFSSSGEEIEPPDSVTFHIWTAYSPFTTWVQIVKDWMKTKGDTGKRKTFVNTTLGETWEAKIGERPDAEVMAERKEHYSAPVPDRVAYLTAGIDSQLDRYEMRVWGWGPGEESWLIDRQIIMGRHDDEQTLLRVDEAINKTYTRRNGAEMSVSRICWDTGGIDPTIVYERSKKHGLFRVIPIKGASVYGKPVASMPRKRNKNGVYLTEIGTDTAKEQIYNRFTLTPEGDEPLAGQDVSTSGLTAQLHETLPDGAVIHIVPRVAGAKSGGVFQIVLGAAAIAGSFFTAGATLAAWGAAIGAGGMTGILFSLGASMVLGGVAQMLAPKARTPRTQTTDNGKQNTYFSSLDNMVAQGNVLPVLYGEMRVGSRVVSQEISTADEGDGGQVVVIGR